MSFEIGLLRALVIVTMVLFATDWFETDVTALGPLMTLVLTGLVPANRAFAGFGRCVGVTALRWGHA
jgi:di/tricarboxylate transporter